MPFFNNNGAVMRRGTPLGLGLPFIPRLWLCQAKQAHERDGAGPSGLRVILPLCMLFARAGIEWCRCHHAVCKRRAPPLGPGRSLTLLCGWNDTACREAEQLCRDELHRCAVGPRARSTGPAAAHELHARVQLC